jgi:hypothetical protein
MVQFTISEMRFREIVSTTGVPGQGYRYRYRIWNFGSQSGLDFKPDAAFIGQMPWISGRESIMLESNRPEYSEIRSSNFQMR